MRPVIVGISAASGSAIPPLVSRLGSSLRTRTRGPIGSTYSKRRAPALLFDINFDLFSSVRVFLTAPGLQFKVGAGTKKQPSPAYLGLQAAADLREFAVRSSIILRWPETAWCQWPGSNSTRRIRNRRCNSRVREVDS